MVEIILSSPLVRVLRVGLPSSGHLHKSYASQVIKRRVNTAPPGLPVEWLLLSVRRQGHGLFTWCRDKTTPLPGAFQVLKLSSSGAAVSGTTKGHWWENVGLLGTWPPETYLAHLSITGMGKDWGCGGTDCLSTVRERSWGWENWMIWSSVLCYAVCMGRATLCAVACPKRCVNSTLKTNLKWWILGRLWASLVAQSGKNLLTMQETQVWSLAWEDSLKKDMATHSSILAWRIPWTQEPGRLQSTGSQRVGHSWATKPQQQADIVTHAPKMRTLK